MSKSSSRDHMKVFKFVQIRRYPYLPADFFNRLRDWFVTNSFELAMFNQNSSGMYTHRGGMGDGSMRGRRMGLHLNFVPKFTFDVKADEMGYLLDFCYYARIRKIGIASAIITQGLTAVIGAATLAGHVATERGFVESVWRAVDSFAQGPYEIVFLEGPEAIDNYQPSTVRTTIITPPPTVIAAPPPQILQSSSSFYQMRSSSSSGVQSSGAPYCNMVPNYPPISSSQPQPPMITNSYPGYGSANRKDISNARPLYSGGVNATNVSGSTASKSQSLYGSSSQQMGGNTSSASGYGGGMNSASGYGGVNASKSQSLYGSNSQQMGTNTSSASGYGGGGMNSSSIGGTQNPFGANTGSLYGATSTSQMRSGVPSSPQYSSSINPATSHPYAYSGGSQAQSQGFTQSQIQGQSQTATLYPPLPDSTRISGSSSGIANSQSNNATIAQQHQQQQQQQQQQQGAQNPFSAPSTTPHPYTASQGYTSQGVRLDKDATQQNQVPTVSMAKGGLGYGYSYTHL